MNDSLPYIDQLRTLAGNRKLLYIATRAVIQDDSGRVLFIRRRDNDQWVMPAGGMELDETVYECMVREVKEETGLYVYAASAMAIYSGPKLDYTTEEGHPYQFMFITFRVDEWSGELLTETEESTDARFYALDDLPKLHPHFHDVLADLRDFDGRMILK